MRHKTGTKALALLLGLAVMISLPLGAGSSFRVNAQVATITNRSLMLSDGRPAQTAEYTVRFTTPARPLIGSIKVEFCENTPLFTETCDPPVGFDLSSATISAQSGETGFSKHPSSTASVLIMRRPPIASFNVSSAYVLSGVRSADNAGTQYARYSTYAEEDASGAIIDRGGIAYHLNGALGLTTEVPPRIDFCLGTMIVATNCATATGNYMQLGDFSTASAKTGTVQMVVGTNAASGYTIRVNGNTLVSGNNPIPALNTPTISAPGNSQFGLNLRANSNPGSGADPTGPGSGIAAPDYNIPNRYTFRPGDVLAYKDNVDDYRKYTVTYLVNISDAQDPGIYTGTYEYVALGSF